MHLTKADLRDEVRRLAGEAFHQKLISGYGDGEFHHKFQITYRGKPRHFNLEYTHLFLNTLIWLHQLQNDLYLGTWIK